jgi:hypothetical protein
MRPESDSLALVAPCFAVGEPAQHPPKSHDDGDKYGGKQELFRVIGVDADKPYAKYLDDLFGPYNLNELSHGTAMLIDRATLPPVSERQYARRVRQPDAGC